MAHSRTRTDFDHPCLACGGPWSITDVASSDLLVGELSWRYESSTCARRCYEGLFVSQQQYDEALRARARRGWSP